MKIMRFLPVCLLILLFGCSNASVSESPEEFPLYSNLDSADNRQEVAALLEDAGIARKSLETVMEWVCDYNDCMRDCENFTLEGNFVPMVNGIVDYGEYAPMSRKWYKENGRDYHDVLCRIVAFALDRENISVQNRIPESEWNCQNGETDWLYSDWSILRGRIETDSMHVYRSNPLVNWDDETIEKYFTLFAPIEIAEGCSENELWFRIREEWTRRGIRFADRRVSLVTVWLKNGTQAIAGHAAILAELDKGYLLFEKTNPESPYSAAKFAKMEDVKAYLAEMMRIDDARYGIVRDTPLILCNDVLME